MSAQAWNGVEGMAWCTRKVGSGGPVLRVIGSQGMFVFVEEAVCHLDRERSNTPEPHQSIFSLPDLFPS